MQARHIAKFKGFTLVEMMMGVSVLTVILAGCFSALGQALVVSENAEQTNFVTELLQCEMNQIQTLNWQAIKKLPKKGTFDPKTYFPEIPLKDYTCKRQVNNHATIADLKEIRLIVSWNDFKNKTRTRELMTYYSRLGLNDNLYEAL